MESDVNGNGNINNSRKQVLLLPKGRASQSTQHEIKDKVIDITTEIKKVRTLQQKCVVEGCSTVD